MTRILVLHLIIMGLAMFLASLGVRRNRHVSKRRMVINIEYVASFLLLFFFLAYRVNLGRDWNNYLYIYRDISLYEFSFRESFEFGFLLILKTMRKLDADFQGFIIITSFITLLLFFHSFRRCYCLLPLGILIFFTQWAYPVVINTIRQGIAIFAFMCALSYTGESGPWAFLKYAFFILLGSLFHYTILLFLPVYWVCKLRVGLIEILIVSMAAFVLSFFLIIPLFNSVLMLFSKYSYSMDSYYSESATFGFGAIIVLVVRLLPLAIFPYVRKRHPMFIKYYLLYYFGLGVYYAFFKYLMVVRITFYLQFLELIVMSLLLSISLRKRKSFGVFGLSFLILSFIYYFYNFHSFLVDQVVSNDFSLMWMHFRL